MDKKDLRNIVLAIDDVEPGLVEAVRKHSAELGRPLRGLVLVSKNYPKVRKRARDESGLFEEIVCDFDDPSSIQQALKPYLTKILVATCRRESSIPAWRQVVPFLPYINHPSESALLWSTEKQLMRERLRAYDPSLAPEYRFVTEFSAAEAKRIAAEIDFPVIVKPNGLASSILVTRCDDEDDLVHALRQTFELIEDVYSRDFGRGAPSVLVEEMIEGSMYSVDAYVKPNGDVSFLPMVSVITGHALGKVGFHSDQLITPTQLSDEQIAAAQAATIGAIRAVNLASSTAHVELFLTPHNEWKIIEIGPRIGGYREDMYREAYGVDHYYNDLAVRMDRDPILAKEPIAHVVAINIYAEAEGHIESITGLEEARELEGVLYLSPHAMPGDVARFATNGGRLIVDGVIYDKDLMKLQAIEAQVRALVKINIA